MDTQPALPLFIDTHAHLALLGSRGLDAHEILRSLFAPDAPALAGLVDISLEPGDLPERVRAFSAYPGVRFASGLWPRAAAIAGRNELVPALERDITAAPPGLVCALGEFGLDHHWNSEDHAASMPPPAAAAWMPIQNAERFGQLPADAVPPAASVPMPPDLAGERELMEMQLALARKLRLPVIIHSRDAPRETAEILSAYRDVPGVIHCFSYGAREARAFLDMGYFISFAGNLTYKNAAAIRDACKAVPAERLLLETDCPFLAPAPFRGKPAHPGMVAELYKTAAEIRGTAPETLAARIAENVTALFGRLTASREAA